MARAMPDPNAKATLASLVGAVLALIWLGVPAGASAGQADAIVYDSLAQLRPDRPAPGGAYQAAHLSAARNEIESFQLLIRVDQSGSSDLRVDSGTPLTGPDGVPLPTTAVSLYRQDYYHVTQRSDGEGDVGLWPDALIPERDSFYGEDRSAFPVDVSGGDEIAVWIDIYVPRDQPAGAYSGSLEVRDAEGIADTVQISLVVKDFILPSTASLKSAFFVSYGQICSALTGATHCGSAAEAWHLTAMFAKAGLNNRVTIANGYAGNPSSSYFDQYFAPLVSGTDSSVLLPGAKLTSVEVYGPSCAGCLGPWKAAAQEHGFASRFFYYVCDEPWSNSDWSECSQNAQAADTEWPGVRKLVTAPIDQNATSYVDIFSPLINHMSPTAGSQRPKYDTFLTAPGKELWLYTSCRSFSCDASEGSVYDGWPGYAIDAPASQARAMGWLTFLYGASGELYYNTTQSLRTATTSQYAYGGNGDGNLFYAGTPAGGSGKIEVGGLKPIPVESIRLKRIRDGREDFEYLRLLAEDGKVAVALDAVRDVFGPESAAGRSATVDSDPLHEARSRLAAAITGQSAPEGPGESEPSDQPRSATTASGRDLAAPRPIVRGGGGGQARAIAGVGNSSDLRLRVLRIRAPRRANRLRLSGVQALVRCTSACRVRLGADLSRRAARRLGLRTTRITRGATRIAPGRSRWITAGLTRSARRQLRRAGAARIPLRANVHAKPVAHVAGGSCGSRVCYWRDGARSSGRSL